MNEAIKQLNELLAGPSPEEIVDAPIDFMQSMIGMQKEVTKENERADKVQQEMFERQMNFINKWRSDRGIVTKKEQEVTA